MVVAVGEYDSSIPPLRHLITKTVTRQARCRWWGSLRFNWLAPRVEQTGGVTHQRDQEREEPGAATELVQHHGSGELRWCLLLKFENFGLDFYSRLS